MKGLHDLPSCQWACCQCTQLNGALQVPSAQDLLQVVPDLSMPKQQDEEESPEQCLASVPASPLAWLSRLQAAH